MRSVALIARTVAESKKSDISINYGRVLLLTIPTLGIYNIVTYYRMIKRMSKHYERQHMLYHDILTYMIEYAYEKDINVETLNELKYGISRVECTEEVLSPGMWLIVSIMTLGIAGLYPLYRFTVEPYNHDIFEDEMLSKINNILCTWGVIGQPIIKKTHCKRRSFFKYLLFTIITLGSFAIYWSYVTVDDFNRHFSEHENWENDLLENLSKF